MNLGVNSIAIDERGSLPRFVTPALLFPAVIGLLIASSSTLVAQTQYSVTNLGGLSGGDGGAFAFDINNVGQVTGWANLPGRSVAFLWTPVSPNSVSGAMIPIDFGFNTFGEGWAINNFGQVAGSVPYSGASIWTPDVMNGTTGTLYRLPVQDRIPTDWWFSWAFEINDHGQAVGQANQVGAVSDSPGFLWHPNTPNSEEGQLFYLDSLLGVASARGMGINATGQVAGYSSSGAFLWTPTLANGTSGNVAFVSGLSDVAAISNDGKIVGGANIWIPAAPNGTTGSLTPLGDLPGGVVFTEAQDINTLGVVVGSSSVGTTTALEDLRAFVWTLNEGIANLNTRLDESGNGWTLTIARGINDMGQIVGLGVYDPDGVGGVSPVNRAFLLTPVPEPSVPISLLIASAAFFRRRVN